MRLRILIIEAATLNDEAWSSAHETPHTQRRDGGTSDLRLQNLNREAQDARL